MRWNWRLYLLTAQIHVSKSLSDWFGRSIASSWATHFAYTKSFNFNQTGLRAKSKSNDFDNPLPCVVWLALTTPVDIIILISSPFLHLSGSSFFLCFQINFQLLKREKKICGLRSSDLIPLGSFDKMEALIRNNRSNETNRNNGSELS